VQKFKVQPFVQILMLGFRVYDFKINVSRKVLGFKIPKPKFRVYDFKTWIFLKFDVNSTFLFNFDAQNRLLHLNFAITSYCNFDKLSIPESIS